MSFPAMAAEVAVSQLNSQRQALDLQLGEDGSILGKLVDQQGVALAKVDVQLVTKRGLAATAKTNADGVFLAKGLSQGELAVLVGGETQMIRLWNAETAPPNAPQAAMFVVGDAVRGQCCPQDCQPACQPVCQPACQPVCQPGCAPNGGGGLFGHGGFGRFGGGLGGGGGLLASPWLLGAGVAAAIAIPLALDDDDAS